MLANLVAQRVAGHDMGRDMEQRELNIGHVDGALVDIDRGHMEMALVIDVRGEHRLRERDDHGPCTAGGLHRADETLLGDQRPRVIGVAERDLRHHLADGIGREELAPVLVVDLELGENAAQDIARRGFQRHGDFGEDLRKHLDGRPVVSSHDLEVVRFPIGPRAAVDAVRDADRAELHTIGEETVAIMAIAMGVEEFEDVPDMSILGRHEGSPERRPPGDRACCVWLKGGRVREHRRRVHAAASRPSSVTARLGRRPNW